MGDAVKAVTSADWESEVNKAAGLVMVDFWATWCGPCRMVAPVVEKLAGEYAGRVKVMKINTDENPDIASKYGIQGIPSLMFFKEGKKVDQIVGAVPEATLRAKFDTLLG